MDSVLNSLMVSSVYACIAGGIYLLLFSDNEVTGSSFIPMTSIEKRLQEIKERKFTATRNEEDIFKKLEAKNPKKKHNLMEMMKDSSEYKLVFLELILNKFRFTVQIKQLLKRADVKMPIDLFIGLVIMMGVPFFLLFLINKSPQFIILGIAAGATPFIFLKMKIINNLKLFSLYFTDALTLIINSLRAGHSLLSSFQLVGEECPYPVNKIFKSVSDDVVLGREMREALEDMCRNMEGSEDLRFFVTAVLVQKEIGGNLTEILDTLNNTIRERFKLFGMIKTQTAQAKMSGIVLALVPVAITGLVSMVSPDYMSPLFHSVLGNLLLGIAVLLSCLGFFIITKITDIKV